MGHDNFARYVMSCSGLRLTDPEQASYYEALIEAGPDIDALRTELGKLQSMHPEFPSWLDDQIEQIAVHVDYWRRNS